MTKENKDQNEGDSKELKSTRLGELIRLSIDFPIIWLGLFLVVYYFFPEGYTIWEVLAIVFGVMIGFSILMSFFIRFGLGFAYKRRKNNG